MGNTTMISFLQNRKLFRILSILFAFLCITGIVLLTGIDLSVPNTLCLVILSFIYLFLYLICYFRGHCERGITAGRIRVIHLVLSVILSLAILAACGLSLGRIREDEAKNRAISKADHFELIATETPEQTDRTVTIRGIVYDGQDYNLYEIPLVEPWQFTEEGFISTAADTDQALRIDLAPSHIDTIYARTGPQGGKLMIQTDGFSDEWDLASTQEGEIQIGFDRMKSSNPAEEPLLVFKVLLWLIAVSILTLILLPPIVHIEHLFSRGKKTAAQPAA